MADVVIRLNYRAIGEILKGQEVREEINSLANQIAANVRAQGHVTSDGEPLPVEVSEYTTDRAAASVDIRHPAGLPIQAKYGVLTQSAGLAGLEVHSG